MCALQLPCKFEVVSDNHVERDMKMFPPSDTAIVLRKSSSVAYSNRRPTYKVDSTCVS